jgi:hypothetical protein
MVVQHYVRHDIGREGVVSDARLCVDHGYGIELIEDTFIDLSKVEIQVSH